MFTAVISLLVLFIASTSAENWALLVAGSNEYYNYRHQADICHAYQLLHKNGIPDERIVVMMYDDIAYSKQNPFQGEIINQPDGPNVYEGVVKDYTGRLVTPGNFLKVLQGQNVTFGSKKVINSGPEDNVFVYFSDHGAPGIIAFPDGSALKATDLNKAIKAMHSNKKFKNLVVYIEACESGSMFEKLLPENINVYATTAANGEESSYACYYDSKRGTYLGDLYSVNWLEDSDKNKVNETLFDQFNIVKKLTDSSHVQQFGNLTMGTVFFTNDFQAESAQKSAEHIKTKRNFANVGAVKSEDVRHSILQKKLSIEEDPNEREQISAQIEKLNTMKTIAYGTIQEIASVVMKNDLRAIRKITNVRSQLSNFECYEPVLDYLIEKCFSLKNEYVLRNLYVLVNLCENGIKAERIKRAIEEVCLTKFPDF